jgi:hypothetical protein
MLHVSSIGAWLQLIRQTPLVNISEEINTAHAKSSEMLDVVCYNRPGLSTTTTVSLIAVSADHGLVYIVNQGCNSFTRTAYEPNSSVVVAINRIVSDPASNRGAALSSSPMPAYSMRTSCHFH